MTSPRRSRDRPIEAALLRLRFSADRQTMLRVRRSFPSATCRKGVCEVKVRGTDLKEVAARVEALLSALRGYRSPPPTPRKALSREPGRRAEN